MGDALRQFYLDWIETPLTLDAYATEHGISPELAGHLIDLGRAISEDLQPSDPIR